MQTAVNACLKRHMNRTSLAVEKVQETFLCEKGEGKIKVLSKEETKRGELQF